MPWYNSFDSPQYRSSNEPHRKPANENTLHPHSFNFFLTAIYAAASYRVDYVFHYSMAAGLLFIHIFDEAKTAKCAMVAEDMRAHKHMRVCI